VDGNLRGSEPLQIQSASERSDRGSLRQVRLEKVFIIKMNAPTYFLVFALFLPLLFRSLLITFLLRALLQTETMRPISVPQKALSHLLVAQITSLQCETIQAAFLPAIFSVALETGLFPILS